MPKLGTTKGKEPGEPHLHSLNIHMLSDGHWKPTGIGGEQRGPPSSAWCQRITPHHCCELFSSQRAHTHIVLRIRGCQVPMIHSLHLPNRISPKPKKITWKKCPLHSEMSDIGHTKLWKLLHRNDAMLIWHQHISAS